MLNPEPGESCTLSVVGVYRLKSPMGNLTASNKFLESNCIESWEGVTKGLVLMGFLFLLGLMACGD